MAKTQILIWVFLLFSKSVLSQSTEFIYGGFKDHNQYLSLNGNAEIEKDGILRLTNDTSRILGHAFYPELVKFKNSSDGPVLSFSTCFAFAIQSVVPKLGGHGFAFTISPNKNLSNALPSQYLGLLNSSDMGNFSNHILAVEFDTIQDFEFGDINDNHIGIDLNSLVSNTSVSAAYYAENSTLVDLYMKGGQTILAWIEYDSFSQVLNVTISPASSKPRSPILSYKVDLSPILHHYMYVGFSASTGLLASSHYIFGWSFNMSGEAKPLDISSLPSLPGPPKNNTVLIIGVFVSSLVLIISICAIAIYTIRKIKNIDVIEDWEFEIGPRRFPYKELKKATKGFRDRELIGFGGFGKVYKGTLSNSNSHVAVKRIMHESKQGLREFISEISSIGRLRHRNLVPLLGWCRRKGDLLLVYEYMCNGSLDKYLFNEPKLVLSWGQRFKIIKGVASGLLYLHEGWEQTVIHRDIKAGNVLLDSEMNGRLGDFGLAKLYEHGATPSTTKVVGTLGYLAPELTRTGKPTTSSDVFAFGALLLEVVCGRRPIEPKALPEELILVDWVWDKWKEDAILEAIDPRLNGKFDEFEAFVALKLGLICSNDVPQMRPTMRQVVRYLDGEIRLPEMMAPLEACGIKKGGDGGNEFEDFVHSYCSSSLNEKVSTWSSVGDGDVDIEAGLVSLSPSSPSSKGRGIR